MKKIIATLISISMMIAAIPQMTFAYSSLPANVAKSELSAVRALYDEDNYTEDNWIKLDQAYNEGITAIMAADGDQEVYDALNNAAEAMIAVEHKGRNIKVCFSAENLVTNQGFIISPTYINARLGNSVAEAVDNFLNDYYSDVKRGYTTSGTVEHQYEVTGLYKEYTGKLDPEAEVTLQDYLRRALGERTIKERSDPSFTAKGDYTSESCYMMSVNNKFSDITPSGIPVVEDNILRLQFSIYGKGADIGADVYGSESSIGNFADRSDFLTAMATLNQRSDLDTLLTDEKNKKLYDDAMKAYNLSTVGEGAIKEATKYIEELTVAPPVDAKPSETPEPTVEPTETPLPTQTPETAKPTFKDVDNSHFAYEAISELASKKIITGKTSDMYYPNDYVTRAEFVTMLMRSSENKDYTVDVFSDVKKTDWFYNGVAYAYNNNITKGVTPTEFCPNVNITRQDMAVMLARYAEANNITLPAADIVPFADYNTFPEYAVDSIEIMHQAEIIGGRSDGTFDPTGLATRAETAKMLYNLLKLK